MDILKTPDFNNIYQVECFDREFRALFRNDYSSLKRYELWLRRRLKILDQEGLKAVDVFQFEKIEDNLYSIRHPQSKHNPRVIYTFLVDEACNAILLSVFLEKNSSDYEFGKKKARNRLKAIR